MFVKIQIFNYSWDPSSEDWSLSATEITDAFDTTSNISLGANNDTFSFKILNNRNSRISSFNSQDNVNIHLLVNGAAASTNNLIMNGLVKKVTEEVSSKGKVLRIDGVSFSEINTNALVFFDPGNNNYNVMQFLEGCLTSVRNRNQNFNVTWNASNPTVKKDGSSFPNINSSASRIREFDRSLADVLEKYLQNDYTEDGRYYWYINSQKELVIRARTGTIASSWTEGTDFKVAKYTINVDDVRNFIVVKCGFDSYNKPITTRYDDAVSRAKNGFKYYMLVDQKIAGDLLDGQGFTEDSKFPASYPYTTTWNDTVNSDGEFNTSLRDEAKRIGQAKGEAYSVVRRNGLTQITVQKTPTTSYSVGDLIQITSPSYNLTNFPLRIKEIDYDKYHTMFTLVEEPEDTI